MTVVHSKRVQTTPKRRVAKKDEGRKSIRVNARASVTSVLYMTSTPNPPVPVDRAISPFVLHNSHYPNNVADHLESRARLLRHHSPRWCVQTGLAGSPISRVGNKCGQFVALICRGN